jgi:hypothetical protein
VPSPFRGVPPSHRDDDAVVGSFQHERDAIAGFGAPDGRGEQIVHQALDANSVDHERRRLDRDVEVAVAGERILAGHAAHQRVDLGASALEDEFAACEPIRVEDVADRVLHPLGLRHELIEQPLVVLALLIGGQGSGEFEDRRQRMLHVDRERVHDLGGGAGGHRRDLLNEGSELVATFHGLLEPGERFLGLEQPCSSIGGIDLGLDGLRRHPILELLVALDERAREHRGGVELARRDGEPGRQVLGLGSRGLELRGLPLAGDLRGVRSLGNLVRADLRTLRPGRELGDELLGAFGAIGELARTGVALLDPAGQIDRAGLRGLGPSLGSLELRRQLRARGVPQFALRRELRRPDRRPLDLRLERVGPRGGGLQRCRTASSSFRASANCASRSLS